MPFGCQSNVIIILHLEMLKLGKQLCVWISRYKNHVFQACYTSFCRLSLEWECFHMFHFSHSVFKRIHDRLIHHDSLVWGYDPALIVIITRKSLPAVKMELDPELEEVIEALNAANNNSSSNMSKNAKLFNTLVAECQVRVYYSKIANQDHL